MDARIAHLHSHYRLYGRRENGAAVQARLDALASSEVAGEYAGFMAQALLDDPAVYLVRRVRCRIDLVLGRASDRQLARRWGGRMAAAVLAEIDQFAEGDTLAAGDAATNVVRFASQAHYVAQFLADSLAGRARDRWYYSGFARLAKRRVTEACQIVLEENVAHLPVILTCLQSQAALDPLLAALGESGRAWLWTAARGSPGLALAGLRPIFAAALRLAALLDLRGGPAAGDAELWQSYLATGPAPADWRDRAGLAAAVLAALRFLAGQDGLLPQGAARSGMPLLATGAPAGLAAPEDTGSPTGSAAQSPEDQGGHPRAGALRVGLEAALAELDWLDTAWLRAAIEDWLGTGGPAVGASGNAGQAGGVAGAAEAAARGAVASETAAGAGALPGSEAAAGQGTGTEGTARPAAGEGQAASAPGRGAGETAAETSADQAVGGAGQAAGAPGRAAATRPQDAGAAGMPLSQEVPAGPPAPVTGRPGEAETADERRQAGANAAPAGAGRQAAAESEEGGAAARPASEASPPPATARTGADRLPLAGEAEPQADAGAGAARAAADAPAASLPVLRPGLTPGRRGSRRGQAGGGEPAGARAEPGDISTDRPDTGGEQPAAQDAAAAGTVLPGAAALPPQAPAPDAQPANAEKPTTGQVAADAAGGGQDLSQQERQVSTMGAASGEEHALPEGLEESPLPGAPETAGEEASAALPAITPGRGPTPRQRELLADLAAILVPGGPDLDSADPASAANALRLYAWLIARTPAWSGDSLATGTIATLLAAWGHVMRSATPGEVLRRLAQGDVRGALAGLPTAAQAAAVADFQWLAGMGAPATMLLDALAGRGRRSGQPATTGVESACAGLALLWRGLLDARLPALLATAAYPAETAVARLPTAWLALALAMAGPAALDGNALDPGLRLMLDAMGGAAFGSAELLAAWPAVEPAAQARFDAGWLRTLAGLRLLEPAALHLHRLATARGPLLVAADATGLLWPFGASLRGGMDHAAGGAPAGAFGRGDAHEDAERGTASGQRGEAEPDPAALPARWLALWHDVTGQTPAVISAEAGLDAGDTAMPASAAGRAPALLPEDPGAEQAAAYAGGRAALEAALAALAGGADLLPAAWPAAPLLAAGLLRIWARWLRGLAGSSVPYLLNNFMRRGGRLRLGENEILVELERAPLDVVLELTGYLAPLEQVPWLGKRTVRYVIRGT